VQDQSIGSTEPAHVRSKPPVASLIADWHNSSNTDSLFVINGPAGLIVDVSAVFQSADGNTGAAATAVTGTVAGATVGQMYVRALDSVGSTTNLVPQGVLTA